MQPDPTLIEDDLAARAAAIDVRRSFIVQAPAGSGKTELLIQRYLCLLETVDDPEEILAITFTRKAAAEMLQRVVDALGRAGRGERSERSHEQLTLDAAARVLARDANRGWDLVRNPRRMRIMTLDAFCAGVARLLPLSSGLGGAVATVSDDQARSAYRAAAVATLDWLPDGGELAGAVESVLDHLDNATGVYIAYVARMLETRDQWLQLTGTGTIDEPARVRRRLEANIATVVHGELAAVEHAFRGTDVAPLVAAARYAGRTLRDAGSTESPIAALAELDGLPPAGADSLPLWQGIAELLLTRQGQWRRQLNKNTGFPPGDDGQKAACLALIEALSDDEALRERLAAVPNLPAARYSDAQWRVLLALFRVLPLAVSELKRLFAEQGVTDHIEVARAAEAALGRADEPGELALMLDYRISHLLVDEMQDTSIAQYRLLETLTGGWEPGDGRTLFCVGDPMQSVYRFRNAEVGRFVLARRAGVAGVPLEALTLRQNFRSGEHLVHWFNEVFGRVFPAEDDIASGAIAYAESVPVDAHAGAGRCEVHALFDADTSEEARRTADLVEGCLGVAAEDSVAVLVRSRTQLPLFLGELRRRGIPYRAVEIDRLTDLPEIIDLIALTRAYAHPGDRIAWLGLLRAPLIGLTWADLHSLVRDEPGETVWNLARNDTRLERLSADGRARLSDAVSRLGRCFRTDRSLALSERIERAWYALGGPGYRRTAEEVDNAYRYFAALERIEAAGTLPDPAELERLLDEERVSSLPVDACRVQVMTMHKAKGLQFDHVVLPSLGRSTSSGERAVLSWLDLPEADGESRMILSPVGARFELENDPLHRYIEQSLRESDRLELDRLLYVACTRARRSLHLVGHVPLRDDGASLGAPHAGSPLARLWPALEPGFREAFEQHTPAARADGDGEGADFALPVLRRAPAEWRLPAADALPDTGRESPVTPDTDREVEYRWVGAAARHAGTLVHRWLHRLVAAGGAAALPPAAARDAQTRRWARQLGVPDDGLAPVCTRVGAALEGMLDDERGRWLLEGDGYAELPLTGVTPAGVTSVVLDRVRIEDGTHWIVDYKTGTHEGGDLARFLAQEAERYRPQLERYAAIYGAWSGVTPRTALYFPLLAEFVEVPA